MQVLSWKPRALYFPHFATSEQCQSIIDMAKANLKPSTLALREGETVESTQGTRTRYLFFFFYTIEFLFYLEDIITFAMIWSANDLEAVHSKQYSSATSGHGFNGERVLYRLIS